MSYKLYREYTGVIKGVVKVSPEAITTLYALYLRNYNALGILGDATVSLIRSMNLFFGGV